MIRGTRDPRHARLDGHARCARGQAVLLVLAATSAMLVVTVVLGGVLGGVSARADLQRAADLGALAGARAIYDHGPRLFDPSDAPGAMTRAELLALGRAAARRTAALNGAEEVRVSFPGAGLPPLRVRVVARRRHTVRRDHAARGLGMSATAEAELSPVAGDGLPLFGSGGGYDGPLARRQGQPMRPDVAEAFDRLESAARADRVRLVITSAYRSDAEQAVLFARNPDPRWVAPPGRSLHRYGTELDLGPPAAHAWLAAHAHRFHFEQRYAWEPWHYGYVLNPASRPADPGGAEGREDGSGAADGETASRPALPAFVPPALADSLADAAQRFNVSAALLAAQLLVESGFDAGAVSPAGARGIAQFMPATARAYGLRDPHDAPRAIAAQAHLMRDLLREFAAVPLALAAYNAGPGPVRACGCVPAIPETRAYVARIVALMQGAGAEPDLGGAGLAVRLVQ